MPTSRQPILFDVSRLLSRIDRCAPTGIDRVELAYAERLWASASAVDGPPVYFCAMDKRELRVIRGEDVAAAAANIRARWREGDHAAADAACLRLERRLGIELPRPPAPDSAFPERRRGTRKRRLSSWRRQRGARAEIAAAGGALYLNVSHHTLEKTDLLRAERDRLSLRFCMFWHDAVPIHFPEYVRPGDDAKHMRRLQTVAELADSVIVNSVATEQDLRSLLAPFGRADLPVAVAPLWSEISVEPERTPPVAATPYFVCLGTIEPRKNHHMLLTMWRDLARDRGEATPALVLVGRRGWANESVFALLDRTPFARDCVIEVAEIPDAALRALLAGARGLLFPSFAEGFGLPVIEAAAAGCPVIASDLPIFHEVGEACVHTLDPTDGPGWRRAVLDLCEPDSQLRRAFFATREGFRPPDRTAHFTAAARAPGLEFLCVTPDAAPESHQMAAARHA